MMQEEEHGGSGQQSPKKDEEGSSEESERDEDDDEDKDGNLLSPSLPGMGGYTFVHSMSAEDKLKYGLMDDSKTQKMRITSQKAASPLVMQWLQENYEASEGASLPRSTLYAHYSSFCNSMSVEAVNAASFGKLIRSIFPTLKTRRLGTRGHSKYHYYGIQIKSSSDLRLPAFHSSDTAIGKQKLRPKRDSFDSPLQRGTMGTVGSVVQQEGSSSMQLMGGPQIVQLPEFLVVDNLPPDMNLEHAHAFMSAYRQHCEALVETVYKQQFQEVEKLLMQFWQNFSSQWRSLLACPEFIDQITAKDHMTYKGMATVLLPNVLQSLPATVPQAIRQFSKQLEPWLSAALENLPHALVIKKMNVAKRFSQSLHKQASLNHLTQAARAVLQNTSEVSQMIVYWNRLDFDFIKDQAGWICQCGEDIIDSAKENFKRFLTERVPLETWTAWIQDIVFKILSKCLDPRELLAMSQQLLLKWSFYSTLIIRDLTICNASSFGSFHLLRTLFDEYIFYLVDTKFASMGPQVNFDGAVEGVPSTPNSVDSFSLDALLSKDSARAGKQLPFPYPTENSERIQDEEYAAIIPENYSQMNSGVHGYPGTAPRYNQYGFNRSQEESSRSGTKRSAEMMKQNPGQGFNSFEMRGYPEFMQQQGNPHREPESQKKHRADPPSIQSSEVK